MYLLVLWFLALPITDYTSNAYMISKVEHVYVVSTGFTLHQAIVKDLCAAKFLVELDSWSKLGDL